MILYSAKSTIDAEGALAYRVTKFVDGEVESSYLTDGHQCDCPAGVRPTCRHRQMLPTMIADGIINTHWFLAWDTTRTVVDFEGTSRTTYEALAEHEAQRVEVEVTPAPTLTGLQEEMILMGFHQPEKITPAAEGVQSKSWRRF